MEIGRDRKRGRYRNDRDRERYRDRERDRNVRSQRGMVDREDHNVVTTVRTVVLAT